MRAPLDFRHNVQENEGGARSVRTVRELATEYRLPIEVALHTQTQQMVILV